MITYRQPFRGEYPITQYYGEVIPGVTFNNKPHTGIDYGCPPGTEILASADGTVMAAGWDMTGYGFRVILKHSDGRATLYAHLDTISVSMGQHVQQGQEIGTSGATGKVTGPHLHFEARRIWNDYSAHFDPKQLPLMSIDDSIQNAAVSKMTVNRIRHRGSIRSSAKQPMSGTGRRCSGRSWCTGENKCMYSLRAKNRTI